MKCLGLIILLSGTVANIQTEAKKVEYQSLDLPVKYHLDSKELLDDWWQTAVVYQIYPRSFKDSDNDGNGDLQGIIQMLDHFTDADIDAIWLSPIFKSPQVDNGYDISDYRDIDPMYGTLEDLRELIDEAHKRNIKLFLDYVPNHTSDQHEWFQASVNKTAPYSDYYIWKNATYGPNQERKPPNNWLSSFKGSAWEWNEIRQQYYYHQFSTAQPDLNYRNPDVVREMKDVLKYWLNFGVDGFRMDAVPVLFEDELLRDEPPSGQENLDPDDPQTLKHIYTTDQNETYNLIYEFRDVLDEFNAEHSSYTKIMMTESYTDLEHTFLYYGNEDHTRYGAHFSFNFISFITGINSSFTALNVADSLADWLVNLPVGYTYNWVLGNHDQARVATRLGVENVDFFNILAAILPGVLVTYQGEEIGQENGEVTCSQGYDPQAIKNCSTFNQTSRDFERTPFQWDNSTNAGFSAANTTWLPVSEKYLKTNLAQQNVFGLNSHYNIYKKVLQIRKDFRDTNTDSKVLSANGANSFAIERTTDHANYALFFNNNEDKVVAPIFLLENVTAEVVLTGLKSQYAVGDIFNFSRPLLPKEVVLVNVTDYV